MLHEFIKVHHERILALTRAKVAARAVPGASPAAMEHGVPLFLEELAARLRSEELGVAQIGASASLHGGELLRSGITIGQVVHDYGDVCQAVTELAVELGAPITTADFKTLNLCLDVAIAEAVSEYSRQREAKLLRHETEKLGFFAHELRNLVNTATLALDAVRTGSVGLTGSTGAILGRSLVAIRDLVNRSLADARLEAGLPRHDVLLVDELLEEIEIASTLETTTTARGVVVGIEPSGPGVAVLGDAGMIASILTNLVQNACKFSRQGGHVALTTRLTAERVHIDVADECGGLPGGDHERLFHAYEQKGSDRSGLGLGLTLSRRAARAMGGDVVVRDVPGTGCVFTLELPRSRTTIPPPSA